MAGTLAAGDPTTLGQEPSFVFPASYIMPASATAVVAGSPLGVPPNDQIAGETPNPATGSVATYGQQTANKPAHKQPILWLVVLVALGVLILSHAARLNLRV